MNQKIHINISSMILATYDQVGIFFCWKHDILCQCDDTHFMMLSASIKNSVNKKYSGIRRYAKDNSSWMMVEKYWQCISEVNIFQYCSNFFQHIEYFQKLGKWRLNCDAVSCRNPLSKKLQTPSIFSAHTSIPQSRAARKFSILYFMIRWRRCGIAYVW